MVVVEMDVHPRHDVSLKIVLDVRELPGEIAHMMIVDERDRRHRFPVCIAAPFLAHQLIADEIAERFGPRRVFPLSDDFVELIEEVLIEGDAEADKFLHGGDATFI
jgi:hypothetical protein